MRKKLHTLLNTSGENLSQKALISGFWVFSLRIGQQAFRFARLVILARILVPGDFGLMGIALLTLATLETFSQTGFKPALVQKKENIGPYLDTTWTFLILRGLALFGILYVLAPYVAVFFGVPEAEPIVQVIGLSAVFQAFTNIGTVYFQKELEFKRQFAFQFAGTIIEFVATVAAAIILQNVWALVIGLLAGSAVNMVASYLVHPYRPKFRLDVTKARELSGFGKWVFGSTVLIFLITQGDDILVGKVLGVTALGLYQLAYRFSNMPATEITHVISQVSFPVYAKLQDTIPKLREAYFTTLKVTMFLSVPIAGFIFLLGPAFTILFLGEKWADMIPVLQLLAVYGLVRSFGATTGPIFQGVFKPHILTRLAFLQLVLMAVIIYPLTVYYGLIGTTVAIILPNLVTQILAAVAVAEILEAGLAQFQSSMLPATLSTASTLLVIGLFMQFVAIDSIPIFLAVAIAGCILYLIADRLIEGKSTSALKMVMHFID